MLINRYNFKGASAPVSMVEVVASSHMATRLQHMQTQTGTTAAAAEPSPQRPKTAAPAAGPKGGLAEAQQGLVRSVQGIRLPGLAHVYRYMYQQRADAAAAAATAATAAAAARQGSVTSSSTGPADRRQGGFVVHRFLRPSLQLQLQHEASSLSSASVGTAAVGAAARKGGSVSSSGGSGIGGGTKLGSLLARSFSQATSSITLVTRRVSRGGDSAGGGSATSAGGGAVGGGGGAGGASNLGSPVRAGAGATTDAAAAADEV